MTEWRGARARWTAVVALAPAATGRLHLVGAAASAGRSLASRAGAARSHAVAGS